METMKRNAEGYFDPTAFAALSTIAAEEASASRRPLIYICSPFSGEVERNIANARRYSRFAVDAGFIPIAPHLLFPQLLCDERAQERKLGLQFGIALLSKCTEVWVFGDDVSPGMREEIKRAKWQNRKLRYFNDDCKEAAR